MFITVEGVEGAGKSTALDFLCELLKKNNLDYIVTREPGGTEIAEKIRAILLNHHNEAMYEDTELLLMFASRAQHLAAVIKPALVAGKIVLCDRFTDASYAYQGAGRGIALQRIATLETWVQGKLRPDLTFILDVTPEVGLNRARNSSDLDRIESEELEFFHRVRDFYLKQARQYPERYKIVDTSGNLATVKMQLENLCNSYIIGSKNSGGI